MASRGRERAVAGLLGVWHSVTVPGCESYSQLDWLVWQGSNLEVLLLRQTQHPPLVPLEADERKLLLQSAFAISSAVGNVSLGSL